jgi:D-galactarolactone cycloisomerase
MTRRSFLSVSTGSALAAPSPVRITNIRLAAIEGRFHKFVAMNSYDRAPKGHTYTNTLVRMTTDQGVEGVGVMEYASPDDAFRAAVRRLIGVNPLQIYEMKDGRITGRSEEFRQLLARYPHLDGPLFDLIGKLTNRPAWRLIGEAVRDNVEVYDGTLYFSDVWFRGRGVRAVVEEAEEAARFGYKGMKFKLGRGWKWMEKDAGLRRDIEVCHAVRNSVGPDVKVLVDANNGYRDDFDRAWRLLANTQSANLHWMEEIFPEDVELYGKLQDRMRQAGMKTLLADGENISDPEQFAPYLRPRRLMDALQMDIRRGGFLNNKRMAEMGELVGAISVPHNWGSQVGLYMGLHLAKAVKAVVAAEDDRSTCDVLEAEGYEFHSGFYTVSNSPGLGLRVDEKTYEAKYKPAETRLGL